ncbi:hypothetical protein PHJA_001023700 [Phtheirospermum japonicum]|uniref:S-protein homolog n=1 Tax=Phtheirospermum japonicum TaxID=374723 RepID=A0A830BMP4_9LAMI|nr:hypothetical protein PHJA_001023700 [Phtheirospermum japonicum]
MRVHCASGDDELGYHNLSVYQEFSWKFCNAPTTLFFCHLWWGKKQRAFDVYTAKFRPYSDYYWIARSDAIYLSHDNKSFAKPSTLFFCHIWWGKKQRAFDVYAAKFIPYSQYYWLAKAEGIYLSNDNSFFTKKFDWQ